MRGAMKTVTPHLVSLIHLVWNGIEEGVSGDGLVKGRIKHRDLCCIRKD